MNFPRFILLALALAALSLSPANARDSEAYELPPINYSHARPHDAVARLRSELDSGALKFSGTEREVVLHLLHQFHIPVESQLLVFSKTSFQSDRIRPGHPRALYYSDNCYVGWVPGGLMEITAIDPALGPVFYSFDPRSASQQRAEFVRDNDCLRCHGGIFVPGIPSVFARSVYAGRDGEPLYRQGAKLVDYQTPFSERWGGWYVTGFHGKTRHRGNVFASENGDQLVFDAAAGANLQDLSAFFDGTDYLTNSSDIVSLLVFEQQTSIQNILTRAGQLCRQMIYSQRQLQSALKEPVTDEPQSETSRRIFDRSADSVVDALLFKGEAELPEIIRGSAEFQRVFCANAPRAPDGSLKDLLLSDHLFKNRCSYLIYSPTFLSLPAPLKRRIYARLARALKPSQSDLRYTYIHDSERKRIAAILHDTHPEFRASLRK